ncbi:MAG: TetR/AcrR family transcriptional regulator [Oceanococcus sp.]
MKNSLSASDWAQAALDAIAEGGIEGVAVEPLARKLGVTKGSFYWHFQNRSALLKAALEAWEEQETTAVVQQVENIADPRQRLQQVFRVANSGFRNGRLTGVFAAASSDPLIGPVVERVAKNRLDFLVDCYATLGYPAEEARRWAMFAYATFMGTLQLRRDDPNALPRGRALNEYVRLCMESLIPARTDTQRRSA